MSAFPSAVRAVQTGRMGWRAKDAMSPVERKMYWAVREETMLHELPLEEHNHLRDGVEVIPAAEPVECSRVLLEWFDQGLMTVMETGSQVELSKASAWALLSDPSGWTREHSLVLTDIGVSALRA